MFTLVNAEKPYLNADVRKSNADTRRFYRRDNLRPFACNLRESALKDTFSVRTTLGKSNRYKVGLQFLEIEEALRAEIIKHIGLSISKNIKRKGAK